MIASAKMRKHFLTDFIGFSLPPDLLPALWLVGMSE
jgi:hypothetical protein